MEAERDMTIVRRMAGRLVAGRFAEAEQKEAEGLAEPLRPIRNGKAAEVAGVRGSGWTDGCARQIPVCQPMSHSLDPSSAATPFTQIVLPQIVLPLRVRFRPIVLLVLIYGLRAAPRTCPDPVPGVESSEVQ